MRAIGVFVATGGYAGYAPVAPGTAGSLVGLGVYALVRWYGGPGLEAIVLSAVVAVGVWSATAGERYFGKTDPGHVVIDEVAGMLLTLLWLPVTWVGALVGFLAFRVFDIIKPFPAGAAERLPRGWGVMADDLVAGVYAHLVVRLMAWATPGLLVI